MIRLVSLLRDPRFSTVLPIDQVDLTPQEAVKLGDIQGKSEELLADVLYRINTTADQRPGA